MTGVTSSQLTANNLKLRKTLSKQDSFEGVLRLPWVGTTCARCPCAPGCHNVERAAACWRICLNHTLTKALNPRWLGESSAGNQCISSGEKLPASGLQSIYYPPRQACSQHVPHRTPSSVEELSQKRTACGRWGQQNHIGLINHLIFLSTHVMNHLVHNLSKIL